MNKKKFSFDCFLSNYKFVRKERRLENGRDIIKYASENQVKEGRKQVIEESTQTHIYEL